MHAAFISLLAIVAFVIVLNFVMLFMRLKRDQSRKPKQAVEEEKAALHREREIKRRIDQEQTELAYQHEMQNKMFDLYDQVRHQHSDENTKTGDGD